MLTRNADEAIKKYKNKCWCRIRNAEEAMKKAGYGELLSAAALEEAPTKHAVVAQQRKGKLNVTFAIIGG